MARSEGVSPTAGALLGLLAEGTRTGWELVDEARERFGNFWTIQRSQVYRELAQLEVAGLVTALPEEERRRRPYSITDPGRHAYHEWLRGVPGRANIRIPFLLTVAFADDVPVDHFETLLADELQHHREQLDRYEALWSSLHADGPPRATARLATLALGIGYERAALEWLEKLPSFLDPTSARQT